LPLDRLAAPQHVIELVKNFEKTNQSYIS
jgi:hypothetical protein